MQENIPMKLTVAGKLPNCSNVFDVGSGHKANDNWCLCQRLSAAGEYDLLNPQCLSPGGSFLCVEAPPALSGWVVYEIFGFYGWLCPSSIRQTLQHAIWLCSHTWFILLRIKSNAKIAKRSWLLTWLLSEGKNCRNVQHILRVRKKKDLLFSTSLEKKGKDKNRIYSCVSP